MDRGFMVVELIVVMAIMLVLSGTAIPMMGRCVQWWDLEPSAFALVQDLRRVLMDAVFARTERRVQFISGCTWYEVETEV